jgi:hypothetical protein
LISNQSEKSIVNKIDNLIDKINNINNINHINYINNVNNIDLNHKPFTCFEQIIELKGEKKVESVIIKNNSTKYNNK